LVNKINGIGAPTPRPVTGPTGGTRSDFNRLLQDEVVKQGEVKFSAHALKRLAERHITLSPSDLRKINEAASAAEAKGARQSLLIYGDLALVASLDNRTVVTAVSGAQSEQRIFTNIDSAVIIR